MKKIFNKKYVIWSVTIVIIIVAGGFIYFKIANASRVSFSVTAVNVNVVQVKQTNVPRYVEVIGSLFAKKKVDISPQIAGQIKKVMFRYGETVREGQSLYQLDDALYQAQLQEVQSNLFFSKMTYQRSLKLAETGAISKQGLDKALSDYQKAQSKLSVLSVMLEKTKIKAPFSGIIGASEVDEGQYVSVGEPLVKLVNKADLIAKFSIPEQYLDQVKIGQQVTVHTSAFPRQSFTGSVTYVSASVDSDSRTVMVWADIANPNLTLAPGLFVHVVLTVDVKKNAILIPQEALIPTVEGNDVFVIKDGKAYQRSVTVSQILGTQDQITKGLQAGDTVVTLGQEKLANGRAVKVLSS